MKLGYLLFGAATVTEVSGAKSPIRNIPKRLDNLKEWAEGCAEKLTPPAKTNVLRKLNRMDTVARKFYNKHKDEANEELPITPWEDVIARKPEALKYPCMCLQFCAKAYTNYYRRGFPNMEDYGKPLVNTKHVAGKLKARLDQTYGCGEMERVGNQPLWGYLGGYFWYGYGGQSAYGY